MTRIKRKLLYGLIPLCIYNIRLLGHESNIDSHTPPSHPVIDADFIFGLGKVMT